MAGLYDVNILRSFERRTVEVAWGVPGTHGGTRAAEGWARGHWAVTEGLPDNPGAFLIVHLPSGLAVPARFDTPEQAAFCLMEIVPLKDDWRELSRDDLARLKPLIIALVVKFGGWGMSTNRTGQIGMKRNGYGEVSP